MSQLRYGGETVTVAFDTRSVTVAVLGAEETVAPACALALDEHKQQQRNKTSKSHRHR